MYTYTVKGEYNEDDLKVIQITLDHPQGHGVKFKYVNKNPTVTVLFLNENETDQFCGMTGLSCYTPYGVTGDTTTLAHTIVFNRKNWNSTPKAFYNDYLNALQLDGKSSKVNNYIKLLYKIYVINHEFGHFLGYDHDERIPNIPCSVMVQQTLGIAPALPNVFVVPISNKN